MMFLGALLLRREACSFTEEVKHPSGCVILTSPGSKSSAVEKLAFLNGESPSEVLLHELVKSATLIEYVWRFL